MDFREQIYLKLFGLLQVPMIHYVGAKLVAMDDEKIVIKIPLKRRTKNHLKSMYFGALCVGADLAGGFIVAKLVREAKRKVSFLFKDMQANFLKRAEGDVYFTCNDSAKIKEALAEAFATGKRINTAVSITATVPDKLGNEAVATFQLTLSIKAK